MGPRGGARPLTGSKCRVMEKTDYSCQKVCGANNAACLFVSLHHHHHHTPPFYFFFFFFSKGVYSLIRPRKRLARRWWEPMEKNTLFYQLCCSYPPERQAGCGNRVHSVCCGLAIAFTGQHREQCAFSPRLQQAQHRGIVHKDGQCTLYLV